MMRLFVFALALAVLASSAAASNYTQTFTLSGGLPFCSQCGSDGEYACSNGIGQFKDDFRVMDPLPFRPLDSTGDVANNVIVQVYGAFSCDTQIGMVEVDFNDVPLNVFITKPTDSCACGSCDPVLTFQGYFPSGFPDYNYGGANIVHLSMATSYICVNRIEVTIGSGKPLYPGLKSKVVSWTFSSSTNYKVCQGLGYSSTSLQGRFKDPLPDNSILVLAESDIFGSYFCSSTSSNTALSARLQDTSVDSETVQNNGKGCSGTYICDGAVRLSNSVLYQGGWPGYNLGGDNVLSIRSSPYSSRIGKAALYLYYYTFSSKEEMDQHLLTHGHELV
eukprot:TRINITY_DN2144_c0_g1_i3.p1 TRINITY_DN2144_c0_g1~~TRINITY_DN2144_c0_g1_i3.p1  ORF type:complete len:369 (-),score=90.87 TRINITY_DN2144_c0_g1_i3:88-1089(-)